MIYSGAMYRSDLEEIQDATDLVLLMALYLYFCDYTDIGWHLTH